MKIIFLLLLAVVLTWLVKGSFLSLTEGESALVKGGVTLELSSANQRVSPLSFSLGFFSRAAQSDTRTVSQQAVFDVISSDPSSSIARMNHYQALSAYKAVLNEVGIHEMSETETKSVWLTLVADLNVSQSMKTGNSYKHDTILHKSYDKEYWVEAELLARVFNRLEGDDFAANRKHINMLLDDAVNKRIKDNQRHFKTILKRYGQESLSKKQREDFTSKVKKLGSRQLLDYASSYILRN